MKSRICHWTAVGMIHQFCSISPLALKEAYLAQDKSSLPNIDPDEYLQSIANDLVHEGLAQDLGMVWPTDASPLYADINSLSSFLQSGVYTEDTLLGFHTLVTGTLVFYAQILGELHGKNFGSLVKPVAAVNSIIGVFPLAILLQSILSSKLFRLHLDILLRIPSFKIPGESHFSMLQRFAHERRLQITDPRRTKTPHINSTRTEMKDPMTPMKEPVTVILKESNFPTFQQFTNEMGLHITDPRRTKTEDPMTKGEREEKESVNFGKEEDEEEEFMNFGEEDNEEDEARVLEDQVIAGLVQQDHLDKRAGKIRRWARLLTSHISSSHILEAHCRLVASTNSSSVTDENLVVDVILLRTRAETFKAPSWMQLTSIMRSVALDREGSGQWTNDDAERLIGYVGENVDAAFSDANRQVTVMQRLKDMRDGFSKDLTCVAHCEATLMSIAEDENPTETVRELQEVRAFTMILFNSQLMICFSFVAHGHVIYFRFEIVLPCLLGPS